MANITLANAGKAKEEALAGMRKLLESQNPDGGSNEGARGFADPNPEGDGLNDDGGAGTGDDPAGLQGGQEGQGDPGGGQGADEGSQGDEKGKDAKAEVRIAELERQLEQMTRSFKAIQSSITPTQQQNARLREEVAHLKAKLGLVDSEGKPVDRLSKARSAAEKVGEVVPEAREAIMALLESMEQQEAVVEQTRSDHSASQASAAMNAIYRAHPDADAVAAPDSPFWKFVDSLHGASAFRAILAAPWEFPGGPETVAELMAEFKATASAQPPAAPVKRPTSVAAPVKPIPPAPRKNSDERPWTAQELEAKTRNLNRMSPEKRAELAGELRKQLYRAAPRRG